MGSLRTLLVGVALLVSAHDARAEDALVKPRTKMKSPVMVGAGIGTIVLACGQEVGFGILAAVSSTQGACGCFSCNCNVDKSPWLAFSAVGIGLGALGQIGGMVLIGIGTKRVPADTSAVGFDSRGLVLAF